MVKYDALSKEQRAVLLLLYEREVSAPKGFRAFLQRKESKSASLGQLLPGRSNKEYENLQKQVQELEDKNFLLAGETKGRDESYWAEHTKLRIEEKGRKFVETYNKQLMTDETMNKFIESRGAKVPKKTLQKAVEEVSASEERLELEDDAWDVAMGDEEDYD
ncbi:MAG: hypothetical protein ACFFC7_17390 [Candidatus Hermodarchaeota archaeon]